MTPKRATTAPTPVWCSAFASDVGAVREVNEDSCLNAAEFGLWAVADGMGGHEGGQIASRTVINAIDWDLDRSSEAAIVEDITTRLTMANDQIRQIARDHYDGRTIGSTVAAVLAFGRTAVCMWAGDSRIYLFRAGRLHQVSRDHTTVEDMVDQGLIDHEEAKNHRLRNVITRAVGAHEHLAIEVRREPVEPGDVLLLCTDGLNKVVSDEELVGLLATTDCEATADALIRLSLQRDVPDNVTVCVVKVGSNPDDDELTLPPR